MPSLTYFLPSIVWHGCLAGSKVRWCRKGCTHRHTHIAMKLVEITLLTCLLSYQIDLVEVKKELGLAQNVGIDYCAVNM